MDPGAGGVGSFREDDRARVCDISYIPPTKGNLVLVSYTVTELPLLDWVACAIIEVWN